MCVLSQQIKYLDQTNVSFVLGLIRDIVNTPTILNDSNIQTSSTYSSYKIDQLLTTLKTDLQNDYRSLINGLTHLNKEIVTTLPTTDIDTNTIYLIKDTSDPSNVFFSQYLYINGQFEMIGTTKSSDDGGISIYDGNSKVYEVNDVVLYKATTDTYYSIYICKEGHTSTSTFDETKWEIVDEKQRLIKVTATQPSETNVLWIDIIDPNNPVLKFHDGTKWEELGGSGGFRSYDDYSKLPTIANGLGDASTLVNGIVGFSANDYTDLTTFTTYKKGFYTYNSTDDEWKIVYEFDFDEALQKLKSYIVETNLRTYTGDELEYGEFKIPNDLTCSTDDVISMTKVVGTLDVDGNGYIVLKASRTYEVTMTAVSDSKLTLCMYDSNGMKLKEGLFFTGDGNTTNASYTWVVPSMDVDTSVYFKVEDGSGTLYAKNNNIVVREMNRIIIIDPVQKVNNSTGIEDDPVGKRITFDGANVPKHYLIEDGSVYNISDYPDLAQHYVDEYGNVAIYGGDGVTTFAVPNNCESPGWWSPQMTSLTMGKYSVLYDYIYSNSEHSPYKAFDGIKHNAGDSNTNCYWHGSSGGNGYIGIDLGEDMMIKGYMIRSSTVNNQTPDSWTFEGSRDGIIWDILDTKTTVGMGNSEDLEVMFSQTYSYRYYRINVTAVNPLCSYNTWCLDEMQFYKIPKGLSLVKYEPTYYINNGTIGDTIAPSSTNTSTDYRLDITHTDGTITRTDNLHGTDAVYVPTNGFYGLHVENGNLILECQDGSTPPPLALEVIDGEKCLTYDTNGSIGGTLVTS